ncbi:MAG: C40 family peptidase [Pseudomonadota bacterium]
MDRRLTPYREDLAADWLEGQVEAAAFVAGTRMQVCAPVADVRRRPASDAPLDTQALCGELVTVYETSPEGWAWGQLERDGYVGYLSAGALMPEVDEATHWVSAHWSFTYPEPDIKTQPVEQIPFGARVRVEDATGEFCRLSNYRFVWARHLLPAGEVLPDFVSTCESFAGTPYLWGGMSAWGFDCSGLVSTAFRAAGHEAPRDSDMLETGFGEDLGAFGECELQRGDLVFWKGHVGVMCDREMLLHCNGYHMRTVAEPLAEAVERIADLYARPTTCRRPG